MDKITNDKPLGVLETFYVEVKCRNKDDAEYSETEDAEEGVDSDKPYTKGNYRTTMMKSIYAALCRYFKEKWSFDTINSESFS